MIYIAAPYTHPNVYVRAERSRKAGRAVELLAREGIQAIAPSFFGHELETRLRVSFPYEYWLNWSRTLLVHCHAVYVLTLPGWRASRGVREECELAARLDLPITGFSVADDNEEVSGLDIRKQFDLPIQRAVHLRIVAQERRESVEGT